MQLSTLPRRTFHLLTRPDASVTNQDHRRNARWLMQLMVLLLPAGFVLNMLNAVVMPDHDAPLRGSLPLIASSVFWIIPYVLCRRGRYQIAAVFLVLAALISIFATQIIGTKHVGDLHFLLMPMLMASVVVQGRVFWMLASAQILLIMALPLVVSELSAELVGIEGLGFFLIGIVLTWRVTAHRNDLEQARTAQLRATNWALKHEIAERKKAQEHALQLAVQQERMRMFTEFIGTAAHDFMTPVSGIMTSQYLARHADDPDKRAGYLDQIEQHAERINVLVDAMLDMSRLESGAEIEFQPTNIGELLRNVCEEARLSLEEKQLQFSTDLDGPQTEIAASAQQLARAFRNLLDNAVQFTPIGGQISILAIEDAQNVIIEICDTGQGIPAENIPHIFDRFFRGDVARSTQTGGLGLGLSYVQRVVTLHNGTIEVESTPGNGTTARIHLPKHSQNGVVFDLHWNAIAPKCQSDPVDA